MGLALGTALAYLSSLPFFLGLFFYLMFGLVIGAVVYRLGASHRPMKTPAVWTVGLATAGLTWLTSLVVEYAGLPGDAAEEVLKSIPGRLDDKEREVLRRETRQFVLSSFSGRQVEGSMLDMARAFPAYVRWVVTDGKLSCPQVYYDSKHTIELGSRRRGWLWAVRSILALVLVSFTIMSQVVGLRRPETPDEAPPAAESPERGDPRA